MKTILILRHAKSSWKHPELSDHERPLSKRGMREAPQAGQFLKEEGLQPDIILCSTAKRARETAQIAGEYCGYEGETRHIPDLYRADVEDILGFLQNLDETISSAMVVGHNPDLEMLLSALTGEEETLPPAGLAQVEVPVGSWRALDPEVRGKLVQVWRPPRGAD